MGAFDNYMAARILRDNPALMQEYLQAAQARRTTQDSRYVMGSPPPMSAPTPIDEGPNEGPWEVDGRITEDPQPFGSAGGLWDDSLTQEDRALRMTQRAAQTDNPAFQQMAISNLQTHGSGSLGGGNGLGFGAARRMIQDSDGDQFWVGNVTNKQSGMMETVYSPIGHDKPAPVGPVELIDDMGQTVSEKIENKAVEKETLALRDREATFYMDYPEQMTGAEDFIYETELTQNKIMELYGATDHGTTGLAKWISGIPLTGALDWSELKSTLMSRLALQKMMQLKAASSTGSTGFGALSAPELKLLTDHIASLEQAQSPKQIKAKVKEIFDYLEHSRQRTLEAYEDDRKKYIKLHQRYKPDSPLTPRVQRSIDNGMEAFSFRAGDKPQGTGNKRRSWGEAVQ